MDATQKVTDVIEALVWIVVGIVFVRIALVVVRLGQEWRDTQHAKHEQASHLEAARGEEAARAVEEVRRYFPWVCGVLPPVDSKAFEAVLQQTSGAYLGEACLELADREIRLPAIWPDAERRKHGYIVGRTGSGKTTLLVNIIKADINAGLGLAVLAPDHELFEVLLGLCERRAREVVYLAPGHPDSRIGFNPLAVEPGDDPARCAGEVYEILRRAVGDDFGPRMAPLLANSVAALIAHPGATLWDLRRILGDPAFRERVLAGVSDAYVLDFWTAVFPTYPKHAGTPLANRLDEVLRSRQLRNALCCRSGISFSQILSQGLILLVNLGLLDPHSQSILAQLVLARLQLALLRLETEPPATRKTFALFCDEFQIMSAGEGAELSWREIFSRSRRYGAAVTVAHQFPSQISSGVRNEVLSNVGTLVTFSLGLKDAEVLRKELLLVDEDGELRPVDLGALVNQRQGEAVIRLGSGASALRLRGAPPVEVSPAEVGERVRNLSWQRFGHPTEETPEPPLVEGRHPVESGTSGAANPSGTDLSEAETRFLRAVLQEPGRASAEYARALGLNGTRAAAIRRRLVSLGYLREHKLARKAAGKPALILEPLERARHALAETEGPTP